VALFSVALFLAFGRPIVALFLDMTKPESAAILAYGVVLLGLAALFQLADGMQVMALGLLRGVKDTKVPMGLAAVSYWLIGIPCSYVLAFPLGFGGVGLWLGLVVGLICASASLMWRFWRLARANAREGRGWRSGPAALRARGSAVPDAGSRRWPAGPARLRPGRGGG
jgi:MATE family multidrug resistance protein